MQSYMSVMYAYIRRIKALKSRSRGHRPLRIGIAIPEHEAADPRMQHGYSPGSW